MKFRYSQLSERISYEESIKLSKHNGSEMFHLGQLKLLISEICFITKHKNHCKKVVYVGAASGWHIAYLSDLFPDLSFDLWDPERFKLEKRSNIRLFNRFFKHEDAEAYRLENLNNPILFISDIRTLEIGKHKIEQNINKMDEVVLRDMQMQMEWVQIIQPYYASLKFRLPYNIKCTDYLTGKIYLQAYSPFSIESRLFTCNYSDLIQYDNIEFSEKLAFFNCCIRRNKKYSRWNDIMKKHKVLNNWDNSYAFYVLESYLKKIKEVTQDLDEKVYQLFMSIIDFHKKVFGSKYDVVFVK